MLCFNLQTNAAIMAACKHLAQLSSAQHAAMYLSSIYFQSLMQSNNPPQSSAVTDLATPADHKGGAQAGTGHAAWPCHSKWLVWLASSLLNPCQPEPMAKKLLVVQPAHLIHAAAVMISIVSCTKRDLVT
jgi:hypothetical protein